MVQVKVSADWTFPTAKRRTEDRGPASRILRSQLDTYYERSPGARHYVVMPSWKAADHPDWRRKSPPTRDPSTEKTGPDRGTDRFRYPSKHGKATRSQPITGQSSPSPWSDRLWRSTHRQLIWQMPTKTRSSNIPRARSGNWSVDRPDSRCLTSWPQSFPRDWCVLRSGLISMRRVVLGDVVRGQACNWQRT